MAARALFKTGSGVCFHIYIYIYCVCQAFLKTFLFFRISGCKIKWSDIFLNVVKLESCIAVGKGVGKLCTSVSLVLC